jgi:hypothetical protein
VAKEGERAGGREGGRVEDEGDRGTRAGTGEGRGGREGEEEERGGREAEEDGAALLSADAVALGLTLLGRIFHAFLRPTSSFSTSSPSTSITRIQSGHRTFLLASEVMHRSAVSLAVPSTLHTSLDILWALAKATRKPRSSLLLTAVRHSMHLLSLCFASFLPPSLSSSSSTLPPSFSLLADYPSLELWLAAFTLKVPSLAIRRAVARGFYQICVEEVRSSRSLTSARKAPELLPLLLQVMVPRLQQVGREEGREGGREGGWIQ